MFWRTGGVVISPLKNQQNPYELNRLLNILKFCTQAYENVNQLLTMLVNDWNRKGLYFFTPLFKEWEFFNPIFLFWKYSGSFIYFKILHSCLNFRLEMLCGRNKPYLHLAFFNKFSMSCPLNKLNSSLGCL